MLRHSSAWVLLLIAASAQAQTPSASMPAMPVQQAAPPTQDLPEVDVPSVAPLVIDPAAVPAPIPEALPAVAAPQVALSEAPAEDAAIAAPLAAIGKATDFSYGDSDVSLLFTKSQMERMMNVLSVYETARRNRSDVPIEVVEEAQVAAPVAAVVEEPATYPVFTLKSIAFRNARDWTVWIGDLRITPHKNDQEVRVLAVSPNRAQFLWKPAYSDAMRARASMKLFADPAKVKHKATRPNTAIYDNAAGQVTFTLLQNQSFSPAYMTTFEGKVTPPTLEKLPAESEPMQDLPINENAPAVPPADTSAANPGNLDALLKQQQKGGVGSVFQRTMSNQPVPTPSN